LEWLEVVLFRSLVKGVVECRNWYCFGEKHCFAFRGYFCGVSFFIGRAGEYFFYILEQKVENYLSFYF
jgi:hypothetical protein